MSESEKPTKAKTEGSKVVLNEVKGRLEKMEAGEMPVIERVGPDGTSRRVDHTGEMVRPDQDEMAASRAAAEAFAAQHRAEVATPPAAPPAPTVPVGPSAAPGESSSEERPGLWDRIKAWFRRT